MIGLHEDLVMSFIRNKLFALISLTTLCLLVGLCSFAFSEIEFVSKGNLYIFAFLTAGLFISAVVQFYIGNKLSGSLHQELINNSLDSANTNVMIADKDFNICYLNESLKEMLTEAESTIKQDLPGFNVATLLGTNIDVFHKNPDYQRGILRNLSRQMKSEITVAGKVFSLILTPVFNNAKERIGTTVEWEDRTEILAIQKRTNQVESALLNVNTNVMIADENRKILFMNKSVESMLRGVESELQKTLTNFNVDKLVGMNMDAFHKNPSVQKNLLENLTTTYKTEIKVAGFTFALSVNPIFNNENQRMGSVVEWVNRTEEVAVETEIQNIIASANQGILDERIEENSKSGFFKNLAVQLNSLLDTNQQVIDDILSVMSKMSQGDLRETIVREYRGTFGELCSNINDTVANLSDVVGNITSATNQVEQGIAEIAQGNVDLQQRTETQASTLEETAASMEEMSSGVKENNENAQQALILSKDAQNKAQQGGEVVSDVIKAMEAIDQSSRKIDDIIGVIDEIAFQTNLLALNAAVEAARAGEQGRGFAVVASEVRNLAQRSASSAKEIKDLIKDSGEKVADGTHLAKRSGDSLSEIVEAVIEVNKAIQSISTSSEEQASGIEQINVAIGNMDSMTQQNSALVEEITASGQEMKAQAQELQSQLGAFSFHGSTNVTRLKKSKVAAPKSAQAASQPAASTGANSSASDNTEWESF